MSNDIKVFANPMVGTLGDGRGVPSTKSTDVRPDTFVATTNLGAGGVVQGRDDRRIIRLSMAGAAWRTSLPGRENKSQTARTSRD